MDTKNLFFIWSLLCGAIVTNATEANYGFVEINHGNLYLYTSEKLPFIDNVYYQYSENEKTKCCLRVNKKSISLLDKENNNEPQKVNAYDTEIFKYKISSKHDASLANYFVGMAIINVAPPVKASNNFLEGSIGKSKKYKINKCLDGEGINLSGPNKYHPPLYFYLGYEIDLSQVKDEVICTDKASGQR